jgi:hypothetical protein
MAVAVQTCPGGEATARGTVDGAIASTGAHTPSGRRRARYSEAGQNPEAMTTCPNGPIDVADQQRRRPA